MLINDTYQILKSLNASPIERLIIKTIEKLNDGKSSFILWTLYGLNSKISEVLEVYSNFEQMKEVLLAKVNFN